MSSNYQPADTLYSKTFIGLLIAQFLAAFNDQAIHASAMFFAINQYALNEAQAISLMPILFYAPWAIFCSLAGYLADRYSKRNSLIFWKIAEVAITLIALVGFWLGTHQMKAGPWIVLSTVFLMGMHSAFFVPAKYGVMPEILKSHLLSRGNGLLESLSFLAVILGTVSGGILSYQFRGQEYMIGLVLVGLAVVGAFASLLIEKMPAANPTRKFPAYIYGPVWNNLKQLLTSKPLAVAVIGLAFFTFIVAFTRATIYMHGESQIPRWTELKTSAIVGMVALGVCFGSPLVGFLSGGKIELGLVPVGILGMVGSIVSLAFCLNSIPAMVGLIISTGFFTGFYVVPLFTLIQHRAPKTSKGDAIATSNLINVTGAIFASILFFVIVKLAHNTGVCPPITLKPYLEGTLVALKLEHGRPVSYTITTANGQMSEQEGERLLLDPLGEQLNVGSLVFVSSYTKGNIEYRRLASQNKNTQTLYDNQQLPRFLFLGAALFTLSTLLILRIRMPDLFLRTLLWSYCFPKYSLRAHGMHNLPGKGPAVLFHEGVGILDSFYIISATDRTARSLFVENTTPEYIPTYLGFIAHYHNIGWLKNFAEGEEKLQNLLAKIKENLSAGHVVSLSLDGPWTTEVIQWVQDTGIPIIPVNISRHKDQTSRSLDVIDVNFAEGISTSATSNLVRTKCREEKVSTIIAGIPKV
jgi:MFS family permease